VGNHWGTKVRQLRVAIIIAVVAVLPVGLRAQNAGTAPNQSPGQPATQNTGIAPSQGAGQAGPPSSGILRITSPRAGERLRQNVVNLQFELTNNGASASGTPDFQVQLDNQDPVTTNSTSYTFSGLQPGSHQVTVQLVDANGTPVAGARSEVPFVVLKPAPTPGATIALRHRRPALIEAALRVEEPRPPQKDNDESLPSAAGALPLLSVIGFGVLLGGIASALKTRPR
jgi:hypothetical protein